MTRYVMYRIQYTVIPHDRFVLAIQKWLKFFYTNLENGIDTCYYISFCESCPVFSMETGGLLSS